MEPLVFSMKGLPRGKGRPRVNARGPFPRIYTDAATQKYERSIRAHAVALMVGRQPFDGPLSVALRFRLPIPKSLPKYQRAAILAGEAAYTGGADVDNMAKSVLDAMNKVVFPDDRQIVRLFVTKVGAEQPGVDVRVEPLAPQAEGVAA